MKDSTWYWIGGAIVGAIAGVVVAVADYAWDGTSWTVLMSTVNVDMLLVGVSGIALSTIAYGMGWLSDRYVKASLTFAGAGLFTSCITGWAMPIVAAAVALLGIPFKLAGSVKSFVQSAVDEVTKNIKKP